MKMIYPTWEWKRKLEFRTRALVISIVLNAITIGALAYVGN